MFFIDPDQKKATLVLLKLVFALSVVLVFLIFTGVKSWSILVNKFSYDLDLDFISALPISFFLTFLIYAFLIIINPEEVLTKYKIVWSLLSVKAFTSTTLISIYF